MVAARAGPRQAKAHAGVLVVVSHPIPDFAPLDLDYLMGDPTHPDDAASGLDVVQAGGALAADAAPRL